MEEGTCGTYFEILEEILKELREANDNLGKIADGNVLADEVVADALEESDAHFKDRHHKWKEQYGRIVDEIEEEERIEDAAWLSRAID